ncbi:MAG TPA: MogA/MoaB family molybdenum cofactor biosynthesis protein [Candidatus Polarisedimenticolia bacterium]|jgi:molybdenum cofactor biosynthesis protein B
MGRREHQAKAPKSISLAVITVSDTRTEAEDESGALIRRLCVKAGHTVAAYRLVPDEPAQVRSALWELLARPDVRAILINGGTGISARDRTFEAVSATLGRRIDGFGELFRALSYAQIGPAAMLSRAVAGIASGVAIFSMPGSPPAVRLAMEKLILPEIGHVVAEAAKLS